MKNSVIGKLVLTDMDNAKMTVEHLKKLGFNYDKHKEKFDCMQYDDLFIIEFNKKPFIMETLQKHEPYNENRSFPISSINEFGITFYVVTRESLDYSDGYIFVPINNINCIHSVTEVVFKKIDN